MTILNNKLKNYLKVQVKNIPDELKEHYQWLGWAFEEDEKGEITKIPKNIITGKNASSKETDDWVNFQTAVKHIDNFHGLGFVPTLKDPFVIWDIDDCFDYKTGLISDEAKTLVKKLNSYTERSPSSYGLRVIVKAKIGPFGRRNRSRKIEIYDSKQYLTITGHHLKGTPRIIRKRNTICNKLHQQIFCKQICDGKRRNRKATLRSAFKPFRLF